MKKILFPILGFISIIYIYEKQHDNGFINILNKIQFKTFETLTLSILKPNIVELIEIEKPKNDNIYSYDNNVNTNYLENYPPSPTDYNLLINTAFKNNTNTIIILPIIDWNSNSTIKKLSLDTFETNISNKINKIIFKTTLSNNPSVNKTTLTYNEKKTLKFSKLPLKESKKDSHKINQKKIPNFNGIWEKSRFNFPHISAFTNIDLGSQIKNNFQNFTIPLIAQFHSQTKKSKNNSRKKTKEIYISLPILSAINFFQEKITKLKITPKYAKLQKHFKIKFHQNKKNQISKFAYILKNNFKKISLNDFLDQEFNDKKKPKKNHTSKTKKITIIALKDHNTREYKIPRPLEKIFNKKYKYNIKINENEIIATACQAIINNTVVRRLNTYKEIILILALTLYLFYKLHNYSSKRQLIYRLIKSTIILFAISFILFTFCKIWLPLTFFYSNLLIYTILAWNNKRRKSNYIYE